MLDGGGGGGVVEGGGGGGVLEGGGAVPLPPSSLISICHTALPPEPSSVVYVPPYFMRGSPLVGGHPFRIVSMAFKQVDESAT